MTQTRAERPGYTLQAVPACLWRDGLMTQTWAGRPGYTPQAIPACLWQDGLVTHSKAFQAYSRVEHPSLVELSLHRS